MTRAERRQRRQRARRHRRDISEVATEYALRVAHTTRVYFGFEPGEEDQPDRLRLRPR